VETKMARTQPAPSTIETQYEDSTQGSDADEPRAPVASWHDGRDGHVQVSRLYPPSGPPEAECDLRNFLKVVRPEWSVITRKGDSNIDRVMAKLKAIEVKDIQELMRRVAANTINEDLFAAGKPCFSQKTLDQLRSRKPFLCALDNLREPYYRQIGLFAPVPQLLAKTNRWQKSGAPHTGNIPSSSSQSRPNTAPQKSKVSRASSSQDVQRRLLPNEGRAYSRKGSRRQSCLPHPELALLDTGQDRADFCANASDKSVSTPSVGMCRSISSNSRITEPASQYPRNHVRKAQPRSGQQSRSLGSLVRGRVIDQNHSGLVCQAEFVPSALDNDVLFSREVSDAAEEHHAIASRNDAASESGTTIEAVASSSALEAQLERLYQAGTTVCAQRDARWKSLRKDNLLDHAEAMLQEQQALDDKKCLFETMHREGPASATRRVVASNIRCRLREEEARDGKSGGKAAVDVIHQCTSIKRNLEKMKFARRELTAIRTQAQTAIVGAPDDRREVKAFVQSRLAIAWGNHDEAS